LRATIALFFLFSYQISFCGNIAEVNLIESQPPIISDSIYAKRSFGTLKIDPLQVILSCEIPASLELYLSNRLSLNLQVGYVFPARKNAMRRGIYESYGENGNATTEGFFYYRNCPYNNDGGIDIKSELRIYTQSISTSQGFPHKSAYFGLQFMYKYCYYDYLSVYLGSPYSYQQTESKKSNILGFALICGKQKYKNRFLVTDLYGGIGIKSSGINYTIIYAPPYTKYHSGQTGYEKIPSLYLSFGLRIGFQLKTIHY
jgi:hypothetical protein